MMMMPTTMLIERDAQRIYETISRGGLALVPTDVGYGLVAMEESGVQRLYELKGRPLTKPCVTVANAAIFDDLVLQSTIRADVRTWIADAVTRTPLALIGSINPHSTLLASMSPYVKSQATHCGTIATFQSAGQLVQRIADLALADGRLIVGSSANHSGTGNNYRFEEVPEAMRSDVNIALNYGPAWYASDEKMATTILDLRTGKFQREGVNFARIERSWKECERLTTMSAVA
jgi:tRNA A37 threonylcarbamoyladenosine synthetase subunit TsaC/SUA5/YrdC